MRRCGWTFFYEDVYAHDVRILQLYHPQPSKELADKARADLLSRDGFEDIGPAFLAVEVETHENPRIYYSVPAEATTDILSALLEDE